MRYIIFIFLIFFKKNLPIKIFKTVRAKWYRKIYTCDLYKCQWKGGQVSLFHTWACARARSVVSLSAIMSRWSKSLRHDPIFNSQLKYKRRVYKMLHLDEKQLKAMHTRTNLRRLLEYVANSQVEKIAKMCSKGLDPNFHCQETGGKEKKNFLKLFLILQKKD